MEIKIKWIKRKQMTHENTYRDDTVTTPPPPFFPRHVHCHDCLTLSYIIQVLSVVENNKTLHCNNDQRKTPDLNKQLTETEGSVPFTFSSHV